MDLDPDLRIDISFHLQTRQPACGLDNLRAKDSERSILVCEKSLSPVPCSGFSGLGGHAKDQANGE